MMSHRFYSHAHFQSQLLRHKQHLPLLAVLAATSIGQQQYPEVVPRLSARYASSEASKDDKDKKVDKGVTRFDITKRWDDVKSDWEALLQTSSSSKTEDDSQDTSPPSSGASSMFDKLKGAMDQAKGAMDQAMDKSEKGTTKTPSDQDNLKEMGSNLMNLVQLKWGSKMTGGSSATAQANTVQDIIMKARDMEEQGDVKDSISLRELLEIAQMSNKKLESNLTEFFQEESKKTGNVFTRKDLPALKPPDIYYYLEKEDQDKNPSVRRRKHRFFKGVDVNQIDELNEQLELALLAYADTMKEIQVTLQRDYDCELAYCDMESTPGRPSHFIAVNKNSVEKKQSALSFLSSDSSTLEVIMVVRGTKTITDIITDLLMDEEEYKGGHCHNGILESGQYLAGKHTTLFRNLLQASGKKKIKLTLIGHSLGAGAATIAGMELNELPEMDVQVIGFGCPALLSKELSQKTESFVTTVVADNDCIPRMSSATMLNAILDIASFDWTAYAKQDIADAVNEVSSYFPTLLKDYKQTILETAHSLPVREMPARIPAQRLEPILYPPGKCIHLYRDGFGISGNVVPCTFFSELDINRRMLHDHTVDMGYQLIFLDLMRQHHEDHHFQFQKEKK
ncbi:unnamed protein product [Cylindrotheca closterium]|uniref:sn-1-specific diacylglycerol lipase n=1 Tax=Cylindrotheca closterium TaxID=2856 RepID=A0AAD2CKY2_9STRA|nr:unnamed protein product [Cylindrotheca closterium]